MHVQRKKRTQNLDPGQVHPGSLRGEHPAQVSHKEHQGVCSQKSQHPAPKECRPADRIGQDEVEGTLLLIAHQQARPQADGENADDDRHVVKVVDVQVPLGGVHLCEPAEKGRQVLRIGFHQILDALDPDDGVKHGDHEDRI